MYHIQVDSKMDSIEKIITCTSCLRHMARQVGCLECPAKLRNTSRINIIVNSCPQQRPDILSTWQIQKPQLRLQQTSNPRERWYTVESALSLRK